jgi:hypothetical protein
MLADGKTIAEARGWGSPILPAIRHPSSAAGHRPSTRIGSTIGRGISARRRLARQ